MSANPTHELEELRAEVKSLRSKLAGAVPLTEFDARIVLLGSAIADLSVFLDDLDRSGPYPIRSYIADDAAAVAAERAVAMYRTSSEAVPSTTPEISSSVVEFSTPQGASL